MIDNIDLIITTRNRIEELQITLSKVLKLGFEEKQIHIVDDASNDGTSRIIKEKYPDAKLYVNEDAKGLIANRNYLMHITQNKYVLSLDDDSCFQSGDDVEEAIKLLESDKKFGIFTFNTFEQLEAPPDKNDLPGTVEQVRTYIGCGHIIKREVIESLGMYVEEFIFYCEELDYSLRAIKKGYKVITQNNLVVHHRVDWKLRNKQFNNDLNNGVYGAVWRSKLGFSNNLLVVIMHYPWGVDVLFVIYYVLLRAWNFLIKKKDIRGFFGGIARFIRMLPFAYAKKTPLPSKLFYKWIGLS